MESAAAETSTPVLEDPDLLCTILARLPDAHALVAAAAVARLWRVQSRDDRVWRALYRKVWGPRVGSAEPPLRDVRVGCLVELSGLTARPDLNGRVAQVLDNEADGTWRVKPVNLVAWEGYLRDQIEVMTRAYSLPPLFGETLSAEDYAASTLDEESLHVQPQNLHGQWRLRFRRRHTGFEFVNLLGGSGQVQVDEHGFSTAVGLQTLTYRLVSCCVAAARSSVSRTSSRTLRSPRAPLRSASRSARRTMDGVHCTSAGGARRTATTAMTARSGATTRWRALARTARS